LPGVALYFLGYAEPLLYGVFCGSLVTWLAAALLRETGSWSWVLQAGALLAAIGVALIHAWVPDLHKYWFELLTKYYTQAETSFALKLTAEQLGGIIRVMAKIA